MKTIQDQGTTRLIADSSEYLTSVTELPFEERAYYKTINLIGGMEANDFRTASEEEYEAHRAALEEHIGLHSLQ